MEKINPDGFFYTDRDRITRQSAQIVMSHLLPNLYVKSAIDIGCGVGTWLSVLNDDYGVSDLKGLDGEWVDPALLKISTEQFTTVNLADGSSLISQLSRRWDLAISLEVAEHLPPECAYDFVRSLTVSAPLVLFSAAIPTQGGHGHLNEQWPEYWAELFSRLGYICCDGIRPSVWWDDCVLQQYRQNTLLFAEPLLVEENRWLSEIAARTSRQVLSMVHPLYWLQRANPPMPSVRVAMGLTRRCIGRAVMRGVSVLVGRKRSI